MELDSPPLEENVPLAPLTTLGVGGPARWFCTALSPDDYHTGLDFAAEHDLPVLLLGGGSNVVISDAGFPGVVIHSADYQLEVHDEGDEVVLEVGAGVPWDELVAFCVTEGLAGVESMSGIPGSTGAAPIQNIGAYGQEVSDVIDSVEVLDLRSRLRRHFTAHECDFSYRDSHFKSVEPDRYIVLNVTLRLRRHPTGVVRYEELRKALNDRTQAPLDEIRRTVLAIRRRKAMLAEGRSVDQRSVGSFFVNPVVDSARADAIAETLSEGLRDRLPRYDTEDGRVKISAAFLIEAAGYPKGFRFGAAGLSTRHALAITNRGAARTADIIALASLIRRGVHRQFGVALMPEPRLIGFDENLEELMPLPGDSP